MLSLNGSVKATSTLTFSGVGYYRWFEQRHDDGNIAEAGGCAAAMTAPSRRRRYALLRRQLPTNRVVATDDDVDPGSRDAVSGDRIYWVRSTAPARTRESFGGAVQGVEKTPLFGLPNQFLIGASYDHGYVDYGGQQRTRILPAASSWSTASPPHLSDRARRLRSAQSLRRPTTMSASIVANTTDLTQGLR